MKLIFLFIVVFLNSADCGEMQIVRDNYHKIKTNHQLEQYINFLDELKCESAEPYLASAIMRQAEYCFWPLVKFKCFAQGKNQLEDFIRKYPYNIEARYVRVLVQSELPAILGYKNQIKSDSEFIKSNIQSTELPYAYQAVILDNIYMIIKKLNL